ncbi:hypothetical protein V6N13_038658 [Hibiscus sabdariffa]
MYGNSDHSRKAEDWNLLDNLRPRSQLPWLLGGDLNAILCRDEKEGGERSDRFSRVMMQIEFSIFPSPCLMVTL